MKPNKAKANKASQREWETIFFMLIASDAIIFIFFVSFQALSFEFCLRFVVIIIVVVVAFFTAAK